MPVTTGGATQANPADTLTVYGEVSNSLIPYKATEDGKKRIIPRLCIIVIIVFLHFFNFSGKKIGEPKYKDKQLIIAKQINNIILY